MSEDVIAKNSGRIQTVSLIAFSEALGYKAVHSGKGITFVDYMGVHKEYRCISLHKMVLLHNFIQYSANDDCEFLRVYVAGSWFKFPVYFAYRAIASKVVESVDVRATKKGWVTDKVWVKWVNGSRPLFERYLEDDPSL